MAKKGVIDQIKQRESGNVSDRMNLFFSNAAFRASAIVPARYRWLIPSIIENISLPIPEFNDVKEEIIETLTAEEAEPVVLETPTEVIPTRPLYPAYRCLRNNPLRCEWTAKTLEENSDAEICIKCGFPTVLKPETRILGMRGTYQIESYLKTRNMGRLYTAIDLSDRSPVVIKEYNLPKRYFNRNETRTRQTSFINLTGLYLADGRYQDERLLTPSDAIAPTGEQRCYLITKGITDTFPTLQRYLEETGALTQPQVRQILLQALQTLEFLHGQKYRFPNGIVRQGLTHGNINLESFLIVPTFQGFYIYLNDPALWENLFYPPNSSLEEQSVSQDLKQLGEVAFYLLAGRSRNPKNNQPLDPTFEENWPEVNPLFKNYILALIGFSPAPFENALLARLALLKLPPLEEVLTLEKPEEEEAPEKPKKSYKRLWWLLFGVLGVTLLALLIWYFARRNNPVNSIDNPPVCCLNQVLGEIPPATYTFTGEASGLWTYLWLQNNLIAKDQNFATLVDTVLNPPPEEEEGTETEDSPPEAEENPPAAESGETSENGEIPSLDTEDAIPPEEATETAEGEQAEEPQYRLNYIPTETTQEAIAKVRNLEADFAVSSLFEDLAVDLWYERFAYDAIVVYVSFSYAQRANSLPEQLNGVISLRDLRRLYTGEITNWQELGGPNLPVKLYIPQDQEAVELFKQRILQEDNAIARFEDLLNQPTRKTPTPNRITQLSTFKTLNAVIRDFEDDQIGAIAFGSLSQVFGQCSVYPLALQLNFETTVSPLLQQQNLPITPQTDLCNEKGSYFPNIAAIRSGHYPLSYALAVIYPRDNRRKPAGLTFIEMLKTTQGQKLLSEAGLVPIRDISQEEIPKEEKVLEDSL